MEVSAVRGPIRNSGDVFLRLETLNRDSEATVLVGQASCLSIKRITGKMPVPPKLPEIRHRTYEDRVLTTFPQKHIRGQYAYV